MTVTISLPPSSTPFPSPDMSSPSSTTLVDFDSAPSSPGFLAPSWQASGLYVPVHKRRQGMHSSASSPAMSTLELESDTRRPTYTREALLEIAKSPFVSLAPSAELLQAFPNIIQAHGHGIDQALTMSSGMRTSKNFHKYSGGNWEQHSDSRGKSSHGRSRSYGRKNNRASSPRSSRSSSNQSDHGFSSGSDGEANWRAH